MEIRELTLEELPLCKPFGIAFHKEKDVPGEYSHETFMKNWTMFLTSKLGTIFGLWRDKELVGGLGCMTVPDITTGELIAYEFFWYVDPSERHGTWSIRLVKRFKQWAKERGAIRYRMVHMLMKDETPSTVKLARVYESLGLRPVEVAYDALVGDE